MTDTRAMTRRHLLQASVSTAAVAGSTLSAHAAETPVASPVPMASPATVPAIDGPEPTTSTFFATAWVEPGASVFSESDGDLWPCAWADDGALYALNGDGKGFALNQPFYDTVANRIDGDPVSGLTGERLAYADDFGPVWSDPEEYNRKPTGLVAVDGDGDGKDELYAAIQDLKSGQNAFDEVPTASITTSKDGGKTWTPTDTPMFTDYLFTTIMFLDFGQSNSNVSVLGEDNAGYVYAYGIDFNWRESTTDLVPDPTDLYLGRAPIGSIQDRATWEFYTGMDGDQPTWTSDIKAKAPVLTDTRRVYTTMFAPGWSGSPCIAQGSVVYNAPLKRYIYSSWTAYTWEFYEAPQPWGPWKLFLHKDFGCHPWMGAGAPEGTCPGPKNGGYGTVIPSKFISEDGKTLYVQSDWWGGDTLACGYQTYQFALRKMTLEPYAPSSADNEIDPARNLAKEPGAIVIEKSTHFGRGEMLRDDSLEFAEDSWDGEQKSLDWWGYTYPKTYTFDRIDYSTGMALPDGGWFADSLRVQVRSEFTWTDVSGLSISPDYPYDETASGFRTFTFRFDASSGDGIRIIGTPGGSAYFTSVSELAVWYAGDAEPAASPQATPVS